MGALRQGEKGPFYPWFAMMFFPSVTKRFFPKLFPHMSAESRGFCYLFYCVVYHIVSGCQNNLLDSLCVDGFGLLAFQGGIFARVQKCWSGAFPLSDVTGRVAE